MQQSNFFSIMDSGNKILSTSKLWKDPDVSRWSFYLIYLYFSFWALVQWKYVYMCDEMFRCNFIFFHMVSVAKYHY